MEKYGDAQHAEVLRGREAQVVNEHLAKHGKALSDFTDKQLDELNADLDKARDEQAKEDQTEQEL